MPELPEVETVRQGLQRLTVGLRIVGVTTYDSPRSFPNNPNDVDAFAIGAEVTAVRRRAKVLLIELSTEYTFMIHLRMTGQLVFVGQERFGAGHPNNSLVGQLPDRSTRASLQFADDSVLYFNDQRKFGWMRLLPTVEVPEVDFMRKVGPEPLDSSFTAAKFIERIRRRNGTTIKAAILDQTTLAGIGNIYADEGLWGAKIHPATRVRDVSDARLGVLLKELKYILELAIEKGGSSMRNCVKADGSKGTYLDFARVFRREGQPCRRHPDVMIEKIRVAGRGTHICPVCQIAPSEAN